MRCSSNWGSRATKENIKTQAIFTARGCQFVPCTQSHWSRSSCGPWCSARREAQSTAAFRRRHSFTRCEGPKGQGWSRTKRSRVTGPFSEETGPSSLTKNECGLLPAATMHSGRMPAAGQKKRHATRPLFCFKSPKRGERATLMNMDLDRDHGHQARTMNIQADVKPLSERK